MMIRVVLADGHALFREAVRVAFESGGDIQVVAEARDGIEAVTQAATWDPDVAVIDTGLPNRDGIRATSMIADAAPRTRTLCVAPDGDALALCVAAFEAGANGFITKASPLSELIEATRAVARGETLVPPAMLGDLLRRLLHHRREQDEALRRLDRLTRREREVLALLTDGADNDRIAQMLVVSPQTARTHIQNVLGKLEVHSRLEAAMFVTQNGIHGELVRVEP